MSRKRIFIVAPTDHGKALGDTLHHVCVHSGRMSIHNCYFFDTFEIVDARLSLKAAIRTAKRMGAKRSRII